MSVALSPTILAALQHAAAHPEGLPLVGARGVGLFPANAAGKLAAQQCRQLGLVRTVGQRRRGRTVQELCALSDQGRQFLLEDVIAQILAARADRLADCSLPELFLALPDPPASIGRFHDALRSLHEQDRIWLHPWTGPLSELPEPALALLVGHEVAYYVSLR